MKNKKRKIAALALCVTLLVGLLATTFSSADDFKAPSDPIVLGGAGELTNIERIQSCYNSNLQTIVTNANLATGATSFNILEIYPGEADTTIPATTFSAYVESGRFATEILTCDSVSVPEEMVKLERLTAGALCAKEDGSKDAILNFLLEYDLVYVNNTDIFDKKGETALADLEADTAQMFFKTYDFTENGAQAFLEYIGNESAPLLMDYNIYKYLNPSTLPGSIVIGPGTVNVRVAELAVKELSLLHFSQASWGTSNCHYVFPVRGFNLNQDNDILSYLGSANNWPYVNTDKLPTLGVDENGEPVITSVYNYKFLEVIPTALPDGEQTALQKLAAEEPYKETTYSVETTDEEGNITYIDYHNKITRLAEAFLYDDENGGTISVDVCTPGSLPADLASYDAIFLNLGSDDYETLLANDITATEYEALKNFAASNATNLKYLYYDATISDTYSDEKDDPSKKEAVDYAYSIISNVINTTTLKSKYSNVVLIDYLFMDDEGNAELDAAKIASIQTMLNTAAYKGILPSSSDRKFNVLEIQPAAPIPFKNSDSGIKTYYEGVSGLPLEDRVYIGDDGKEYSFLYQPQGTINNDGTFKYDGVIKAVYSDGNGSYYFLRRDGNDSYVLNNAKEMLPQSVSYMDQKVDFNDPNDLGIRPVYASIEYQGQTYTFNKIAKSGNQKKYEVVYKGSKDSIYINYDQVWLNGKNIYDDYYANVKTIGDPIKYVSFKATPQENGDISRLGGFFTYEKLKDNVILNDGVNPPGSYTLYTTPQFGYFMYVDGSGNVYVMKEYNKCFNWHGSSAFSGRKYSFSSETGIYSYHITKSKIADLIGIEEGKINIDNYTVNELNCKVDDLVNTYDLVIIGGDVSALREFKNNNSKIANGNYYRRMTVDDKHAYDMYYHTGDNTVRDGYFVDGSSAKSVLIGSQKNDAGKVVYVSSGMDLSYTKQQELYNYINSGRPVLIEQEVMSENNAVSTRIDPMSNMGIMLKDIASGKNAGDYENILTGFDYKDTESNNGKIVYKEATKTKIINTINCETSMIRPTLNIVSAPIEYQDQLPKDVYAVNGHKFNVEYNIGSEAGNNMAYEVNLYFDVNMDGRFSEDEIYGTQEYRTGVDKNKIMEYELVDTFFGILSWKLEATSTNSSGAITQVSQLGYAGYDKASGEKEELKVLQIVPRANCNLAMCVNCDGKSFSNHQHVFGIQKFQNGGNSGNLMNEFAFKDYFDIKLTIQTTNDFCKEVYDTSPLSPGAKSVMNEDWLIDKYDMIVIGFYDSYDQKDFTKIACAELIRFSDVNSLLCSHDNIGIINSGAKYDDSPYKTDTKKDPDRYAREVKTDWSYNMGNYYNPSDSIYNSSVRYIFGAARFFTLDKDDPFTNKQDGSEFYTDYNVDSNPSKEFMSGVFGGQTDATLGWRIGADTSSYKNTSYAGTYNETKKVRSTNDGIITRYPFALPEKFATNTTHSQYAQLDLDIESTSVWYCLDSTAYNSIYNISPNDGRNNYYIYSNKNVTYTGAGHSDITPTFDNNYERKLFINTVFLSFNARNNPPIIEVEGDGIDASESVKIKTPETQIDALAEVESTSSIFEYDLKVLDDLQDRFFTGYIYIDKTPDGKGYDKAEDTLVGIIKYKKGSESYIYYDLMKNGETRRMTSLQLKQEYFDLTNITHLSLQIFDRFPYTLREIKDGKVPDAFIDQQSKKTLSSVYTIRIHAEAEIDIDLWDLN